MNLFKQMLSHIRLPTKAPRDFRHTMQTNPSLSVLRQLALLFLLALLPGAYAGHAPADTAIASHCMQAAGTSAQHAMHHQDGLRNQHADNCDMDNCAHSFCTTSFTFITSDWPTALANTSAEKIVFEPHQPPDITPDSRYRPPKARSTAETPARQWPRERSAR